MYDYDPCTSPQFRPRLMYEMRYLMASPRFSLAGQRGSWTDMRVQRQSDSLDTLTLMMTLAVSRRLLSKYQVTESEGMMSATLWKVTPLEGKYKHVKSEIVFTKYLLTVLNCLPVGVVPLQTDGDSDLHIDVGRG